MAGLDLTAAGSRVEPSSPGEPRWVRPFVAVGVALVLLLVGATAGLLIGLPGQSRPEPGPVDVGFAQAMTIHHLQAVEMSGWVRDHTTDPVIAQLATDVERTQNNQVGQMQGWLTLWDEPALPLGDPMAWMADGSTMQHGASGLDTGSTVMPGLASQEELARLRAATGTELDVLYLQLLLRHHQGGVEMLAYGAERAAVPQVRSLAAQMLSAQSSEADYLRQLLAERGGEPLPL